MRSDETTRWLLQTGRIRRHGRSTEFWGRLRPREDGNAERDSYAGPPATQDSPASRNTESIGEEPAKG